MKLYRESISGRLNVLTDGWFLVCLLVLIVNDHILKQTVPSALTGKLSDFAGLFVFAFFLYVLTPSSFRNKTSLSVSHIAIAVAFVLWKLAPIELLLDEISRLTLLPVPTRVKDPSDLAALAVLPLSYFRLLAYEYGTNPRLQSMRGSRPLNVFILIVAGWSIMATSESFEVDELDCCYKQRGNVDFDDNYDYVDVESDEIEYFDDPDIRDILYLEDYLFHGGARPQCLVEADVNATGDKNPINSEDLMLLVEYCFASGAAPENCP